MSFFLFKGWKILGCLCRLGLVLASTQVLLAAQTEEFDSYTVSMVMVPMRDGVKLATDIYRPARANQPVEAKFPVLVYRTPYNRSGIVTGFREDAISLAKHGYIVAVQDCRGQFDSEGEFYPFINEGKDGFDTIEWAGTQPWSTGKVGTLGPSYMGWDQYLASLYHPPHLVAMFALVGGSNFYNQFGYPGGAPNLGWPMWLLYSAISSPQAARDPVAAQPLKEALKNAAAWLASHPQKRAEVFRAFPNYLKAYEDFYNHPAFDDYWKQHGFYTPGYYRQMKDVPIFFVTGWYDYFGEGVLENFSWLKHFQSTPKNLIVGPWPHNPEKASCGDIFYGNQAGLDVVAEELNWFDHWLKGRDFQTAGTDSVRYFRMGGGSGSRNADGLLEHGGEWMTSLSWPPAGLKLTKYYLRAAHLLSSEQPAQENSATYVFDPDNPVPTIGGRYGGRISYPHCGQDQVCSPTIPGCPDSLPLEKREDVISFLSAPLDSPVEVTGNVRCELWVSSDAVDTDFTAKLMDIYPNGYALILTDGVTRARYRKGFERPELMKPGKIYKVAIDLGSTSNLFLQGHKIRLDISSSNYPAFETNPNTGEMAGSWTHRIKARNTVYHEGSRPSFLLLPTRAPASKRQVQ